MMLGLFSGKDSKWSTQVVPSAVVLCLSSLPLLRIPRLIASQCWGRERLCSSGNGNSLEPAANLFPGLPGMPDTARPFAAFVTKTNIIAWSLWQVPLFE